MNFGYRRSLPHMLGIIFGHAFMEFAVALGLGAVYQQFPIIELVLKIVAVSLLLYLAYRIATAPVDKLASAKSGAKPWTFWQAFIFQWVNPKAWLIAIGVASSVAGKGEPFTVALFVFLATAMAGVISTNLWTGFGVAMARVLNTPTKRRIFNYFLAALLVLSVVMLLVD